MMATAELVRPVELSSGSVEKVHFYRPELDVLRFFAFMAVYLCHSIPSRMTVSGGTGAAGLIAGVLMVVKEMGNFGVCLFFLLSAFLITELIRREGEKYGSVHLASFYIRRILRIWPLYFGITIAYAIGGIFWPALHLERGRIIAYFLLAGNWYIAFHPWIQTPLRALWSISVEEQFYAVWPVVAKVKGMRGLAVLSLVLVPLSLFAIWAIGAAQSYTGLKIWLNSVVQFQFFAWGALIALICNGTVLALPGIVRVSTFFLGMLTWLAAAYACHIKSPVIQPTQFQFILGYLLVGAGCILFFFSFAGIQQQQIPAWLSYLGKISFGLYVFHETAYLIVDEVQMRLPHLLHLASTSSLKSLPAVVVMNKISALFLTIALAHCSYRFFESPFLRLKQRFSLVESRPV